VRCEEIQEIPFIDPTVPFEIKKEPECSLKITEVHTVHEESQTIKEPSSDEWPEEPEEVKQEKRKKKKRIRPPRAIAMTFAESRKRTYEDPELDREIENLPDTESGWVNCSKCYRKVSKKLYRRHMERFHLDVKHMLCDKCGKKFYSHLMIEEHMNTHLGIKTYSSKNKLAENSESKNHQLICELCAKPFKDNYNLKVIMRAF
jgi:hypothetical protein